MRDISKFCRIYCHSHNRKWAELIPYIENWLNNAVAIVTLYTPVEPLFGTERNNLFKKCLPNLPKGGMKHEEIQEKTAKAYERIKQRAHDKKQEKARKCNVET
jgi:hypothetical protein